MIRRRCLPWYTNIDNTVATAWQAGNSLFDFPSDKEVHAPVHAFTLSAPDDKV